MAENNYGNIKAEHKIVLQAVEAANSVFVRVVNVREIVEALTEAEKEELRKTYAKSLPQAAAAILELLAARGLVFIKRGAAKRYYGAASLLDVDECQLPNEPVSRRRVVLQAVREAVQYTQRAVHPGDVYNYAKEQPAMRHLTNQLIVRDMNNLTATGELKVIGAIYGDGAGSNLYLPAELETEDYLPKKPLTWLELVNATFSEIWREKVGEAIDDHRKPYGISTAEVRARLESLAEPHDRLNEPCAVTNALKYLSEAGQASVRRIKTGSAKVVFWCPAGISPDEVTVENLHITDSRKVAAALNRAYERLNRPVTATETQNEINQDSSLTLSGKNTAARVLNDAGKKRIGGAGGKRSERVELLAQRVGICGGNAYYCPPNASLEEAREYTALISLSDQWNNLITVENIELFEKCRLRCGAIGRARLFLQNATAISSELIELTTTGKISGVFQPRIIELQVEVNNFAAQVTNWLNDQDTNGIPAAVVTEGESLTAKELLQLYLPLYPVAGTIKDVNRIITLLSRQLRRTPNPKFISRFYKETTQAASYLFDKTDALIYAALKWGGSECRFQALLARHELGTLRDYRFILPAIKSYKYEDRLTAIACLAFLRPDGAFELLRPICLQDENPNVRKSALWAYAFIGGHEWRRVVKSVEQKDGNTSVKSFAATLSVTPQKNLWFL